MWLDMPNGLKSCKMLLIVGMMLHWEGRRWLVWTDDQIWVCSLPSQTLDLRQHFFAGHTLVFAALVEGCFPDIRWSRWKHQHSNSSAGWSHWKQISDATARRFRSKQLLHSLNRLWSLLCLSLKAWLFCCSKINACEIATQSPKCYFNPAKTV